MATQPAESPNPLAIDWTKLVETIGQIKEKGEKGPNEADVKRLTGDMQKIEKGYVGDLSSVENQMKEKGMWEEKVDLAKIPESLRNGASSAKTWGDVFKGAAETGWKNLDTILSSTLKGDNTHKDALMDMISGKGSHLNTANIKIMGTDESRLKETKKELNLAANLPTDRDKMTVSLIPGYASANVYTGEPKDEVELLRNYDLVAKGKTDGIPKITEALEGGQVKGLDGKVVTGGTVISNSALAFVPPGSELREVVEASGLKGDKLTYGKLLDYVAENSRDNLTNLKAGIAEDLSSLTSAVDSMLIPGSAGNDRATLFQNMEKLSKEFDPNNKNGKLAFINEKYGELADKLNSFTAQDLSNPANKRYLEDLQKDMIKVQERTANFFNTTAGFFDQAKGNMKQIESREEKERIANIISGVFAGLAAFGSMGFVWSNSGAVIKQLGGAARTNDNWGAAFKGNLPALFGSGTLFANNAVQTGVNGNRQAMQDYLKKTFPNISAGIGTEVSSNLKEAWGNMMKSYAETDYYLNNRQRFKDYAHWAYSNRQYSSLFGNGDDKGYKGPMPYVFWKPNSSKVSDVFAGTRYSTYMDIKDSFLVKPDWST